MEAATTAIADTLTELRNQNALLRQANLDDKNAQKERTAHEQNERAKRDWVSEEATKMERCEGLPAAGLRAWLRDMRDAIGRTLKIDRTGVVNPDEVQARVDRELGKKLMARTAGGELVKEVDKCWASDDQHTVIDVLREMESVFLGSDEPAARRSEVDDMRQPAGSKPENQIPAYSRRFQLKADEAYGVIDRSPEHEETLAELYITSLNNEDVARELFEATPPIATLQEAITKATAIYNRGQRMARAWKGRRRNVRRETPMEIGQMDATTQKALLDRIAKLESQLAASKVTGGQPPEPSTSGQRNQNRNRNRNPDYNGPRIAGPKTKCYECDQCAGHFARDCPDRKARLAREAAAAASTE